ncbi:MAG: hypothetical protein RIR48_884, partial [Bacteroidota bacterium]
TLRPKKNFIPGEGQYIRHDMKPIKQVFAPHQ